VRRADIDTDLVSALTEPRTCSTALSRLARGGRPSRNGAVDAALVVDGVERARDRVDADLADRLRAAARLLEAVGERLAIGDRIITGSVVQVPVERGNEIAADLGPLGAARLAIAA
jgi:2-keto-4-pentenoate hydratase